MVTYGLPSEWRGTVYPSSCGSDQCPPAVIQGRRNSICKCFSTPRRISLECYRWTGPINRTNSTTSVWSWIENPTCELELASCVYWSIANDLPGGLVPVFGYRVQRRPIILVSSSDALQDLIKSRDWTKDLGSLAQAVIGME